VSLQNMTKQLFASELIKMVREMPFEKVRVVELCKRCETDRRTFYYHFIDKYDLAAWIFSGDYLESLSAEQGRFTLQHAINILEKMYHNRSFYRAIFSDTSQNAIRNYSYKYFCELGFSVMKKHFGIEVLTKEMDYAVRAHSHACCELSFEWLKGDLDYTPEQFAILQYRYMPAELKAAYGIEGEYSLSQDRLS